MVRSFEDFPNLVSMFFSRARQHGDAPILWRKHGDGWQPTSWAETARQVARLAEALAGLGLNRGDRVALVSENRPEWCIARSAEHTSELQSLMRNSYAVFCLKKK